MLALERCLSLTPPRGDDTVTWFTHTAACFAVSFIVGQHSLPLLGVAFPSLSVWGSSVTLKWTEAEANISQEREKGKAYRKNRQLYQVVEKEEQK